MYVFVHACVCMYVFVHACVCMYVCICACMCVCSCASVSYHTDTAVKAYSYLYGGGVLLRASLLCRLLELAREQPQAVLEACLLLPQLVCTVLQASRSEQGSCTTEIYHCALRVLDSAHKPIELVSLSLSLSLSLSCLLTRSLYTG